MTRELSKAGNVCLAATINRECLSLSVYHRGNYATAFDRTDKESFSGKIVISGHVDCLLLKLPQLHSTTGAGF